MALNGEIIAVERIENDIKIELAPRLADAYIAEGGEIVQPSLEGPGQRFMYIKNGTFEPKIGDVIWGSSGSAEIVSGDFKFPYKRELYTGLIQDWQ